MALGGCPSLTSVTIPSSLTNIGVSVFGLSSALTNISVDAANPSYASAGGVLFNKAITTLITFPEGLTGSYAIPNSVTYIGDDAFGDCHRLTSVWIGNNVTSIGDYAFEDCGLTNVTVGSGLTNVGESAFSECGPLGQVIFPANAPLVDGEKGSEDSTIFYADSGTVYRYSGTTGWGSTFGGWPVVAVNPMLALIDQPTSQAVSNSGSATFTVFAIGQGNLAYQWYFDGSPIENATSENLTLTNITTDQTGGYFAVITNSYGSVTSSVAALSLLFPFTFVTNNGTITITGWRFPSTVPIGNLIIPDMINGYPVTVIGTNSLEECGILTSVTIPNTVTSVCHGAFWDCAFLTNVLFGNSVTNIGDEAFMYCSDLTSVTIPSSVANLGQYAFSFCPNLTNVFFHGNAPTVNGENGSADSTVFDGANGNGTVYFLPGASGWTNTFGGWPTAQWFQPQPTILGAAAGFNLQSNQFNFTISWATNAAVIIQTCTNLANPIWTPVATNALSNGQANFSDPNWTTSPSRFYRVSSQ
jgi:hypothetical protein